MPLARQIDCLIATGTAVPPGPQYLASSTVLALAETLAAQGCRAGILVIDLALDPALVTRDSQDGIDIFRSSQPVSSLPALSYGLGIPRILVLPNQLSNYQLVATPGLDAVIWLGEDDLAVLGRQSPAACLRFLADSAYVATRASALLQKPVTPVMPPLGPGSGDPGGNGPVQPQQHCVAVIGARPCDGIALILTMAEQRRDLRFIVIEWPYLTTTERQAVFAHAARCGNIDWRHPDGPAALMSALLEAQVILAPAQSPVGHRDWLVQCRRAGRQVLGSALGALPDLVADQGRVLAPEAPIGDWLQQLDHLRLEPAPPDSDITAPSPSVAAIISHLL